MSRMATKACSSVTLPPESSRPVAGSRLTLNRSSQIVSVTASGTTPTNSGISRLGAIMRMPAYVVVYYAVLARVALRAVWYGVACVVASPSHN